MPLILTADANPGDADWSTQSASHVIAAAGQAVILNGTASIVVPLAGLNGAPVLATLNEVDGVITVLAAKVAAGQLTITVSANVTANRTVSYAVLAVLA